MLLIEDKLNVSFMPPQEDVDSSIILIVETLYQNLIKEIPIRDNKKIDSLDGEWDMRDDNEIKKSIGESIYFEFQMTSHISLFGVELDLPGVIGIFNATLSNFSVKGKRYKLLLENLNEEKHMYTSVLRFSNEDLLEAYMQKDSNERITALHEAKTAQDHLIALEN